jgi:hypothetical protein
MYDNCIPTRFITYAELCKQRASGETAYILEFIRGERAFDQPGVSVVLGEKKR